MNAPFVVLPALLVALCLPNVALGQYATRAEPHTRVSAKALNGSAATSEPTWVFFADRGFATAAEEQAAIAALADRFSPRAIQRRELRRTSPGVFDARDLPVCEAYVAAALSSGARLRQSSSWLNAISVDATPEQAAVIAAAPFVAKLQPVRRARVNRPAVQALPGGRAGGQRGFYGYAEEQLAQINLLAVHAQGFNADSVVVGVLDTGFERSHVAFNQAGHVVSVLAEWDFLDNDPDTSIEPGDYWDQHTHGTLILGTLAAYMPNELVGGAFNATYVLAKTEDVEAEYPAEEDNYVAGLEFVESQGADLATSSLGYIDWYSQSDLDGATAVTTLAVNIATDNGLHCLTAAGNEGNDGNPNTSHLIAPADALTVLAIGAVDNGGAIADFSSDGPTADGRVKPELLARGVDTVSVWPYDTTGYAAVSGTSLSTPLAAGVVACLVQAHPEWTVAEMRAHLLYTSDYYLAHGTFEPDYVRGYGIIDADAALHFADCNENTVHDADDIASGTSQDSDGNGIPDECQCATDLNGDLRTDLIDLSLLLIEFGCAAGCTIDFNGDGVTDLTDLSTLLIAFGTECS